jgi:hypothetical protein
MKDDASGPSGAQRHANDEDPVARALGYPYPRHPGPVLFDPATGAHSCRIVDIGPEREHPLADPGRPLPVRAIAVEVGGQSVEINDTVALIAAGSNGSTVQLARKYRSRRDARPILIAPVEVSGAVSVYSAHIAAYGSVPATMSPAPGARASLHVLLMPAEELAHMNGTESLGVNYVLAAPSAVSLVLEGIEIARPLAYVSTRGALVLDVAPMLLPATGGAQTGYPVVDQRDVLEKVRRHVGSPGSLEGFLAAMIGDADARRAVIAQLAATARRWDLGGDEIVADGT